MLWDSWSLVSWTLPGPFARVRCCAISIRGCGPIAPLLVPLGPRLFLHARLHLHLSLPGLSRLLQDLLPGLPDFLH